VIRQRVHLHPHPTTASAALLSSSATSDSTYSPQGWGGGDDLQGFSVANPLGVGRGEGRLGGGPPVQVRRKSPTLDKQMGDGLKGHEYLQ
jgi:hypothetical protein